MPDSTSEAILKALFDALVAGTSGECVRNLDQPTKFPPPGLIILRDGDPSEPEVWAGNVFNFEHMAEIELIVPQPDADARFDTLKQQIGAVIAANRTLGGRCDWVEAQAPAPVNEPILGANGIKAAIIPVMISFATTNPLG